MRLHLKRLIRRKIGQILIDAGFISSNDLERAFMVQKRTKELLGEVLVIMGVIKKEEIRVPLLIQDRLSNMDDAVRTAAGERQLLGALLVDSGQVTAKQLNFAIAEQKRTGEKLGHVFTRLEMLTERQLEALLEFQHNEDDRTVISTLRLGELLVATGYISRRQLDDALLKQNGSHKKIGEVLVEEGYLTPAKLQNGFRLQRMLVGSVLASILSLGMRTPAVASAVSLQWDPVTASSLAGYKLYYCDTSSLLSTATPIVVDSTQTVASIDGLDPGKAYQFAVTAYDSTGVESVFSNIVTLEEQIPPTVSITSPSNSATVSGVVSVAVSATDNVGVTKVEYYVNGVLKATDTISPYTYSFDTTAVVSGAYTITVKAYDAAGNIGQSSSTLNVVNDTIAPIVAVTSPVNNATVSGTVTVSSSASDNVGVTNVAFYSNGTLLYSGNVAPFTFNWDTTKVADGNYSILAIAKDNAGNSTQSSTVSVTVKNIVADTTAPTMSSFTLPTTSTSLTVPVSTLSATDAIGVTGYIVSESATVPTSSDSRWSGTAPTSITFTAAGSKTAYAWAKDAAGNVSASRSASVVITLPDVTAPTMVSFTLPAASSSLTVPISALSATDAVGVTGYIVSESATVPTSSDSRWSGTAPTSITFTAAGSKTAYAWAKDAAGNVSASRSASVIINVVTSGTVVFADNSGGSKFKDSTGITYLADSKYTGGSLGTTTAAISGTVDDTIYRTERYGNFSYDIQLANGDYSVTLKFAETYFSASKMRIFSVKINGETVISNLDIFAKVGKNAAFDVVLPASVTNGTLSIEFVSQVNNAKVSGILVKTR